MKAFVVFPPPEPWISGCVLVWAETRGKAKVLASELAFNETFIELRARRAADWDNWKPTDKLYVMTNDDLPEGAPDFYTEEL